MNIMFRTTLFASLFAMSFITLSAQNQVDDKGRKQGQWIKKNNKGQVIYKGQFKDDYPIDTFYYYNSKAQTELRNIYSDKGQKVHSQFLYTNGKIKAEGDYIKKKKEGLWSYFSEKGKLITQENFKNNFKDGVEKKWDISGLNLIEQTTYKQGVKQGAYFQSLYGEGFYTANFEDNKLQGEYKEFYPDSTLKIKGQYEQGWKQGTWEVYNMSGSLVQKLFYVNDELSGDLILFNVQQGVKEIPQKEIALLRQAGKQTQLVLFNGDRINVFNSIGSIVPLTSAEDFIRMSEKGEVYLNISVIEGVNTDGSVRTSIDFGYKIMPDKDGAKALKSMFRKDFDK